ncbi:MAG: hypothetical protein VYC40_03805, partial [Pseudomonadota bacterium]|nr:hypothetical protein [Pseudomonadota bacterium]
MFKETLDLIKGMVTFMRSRSNIAGTAIVAASLMSGVSFAANEYNVTPGGTININNTGSTTAAQSNQNKDHDLVMETNGTLTFAAATNGAANPQLVDLDMAGFEGVITVGPVAITNIFQSVGGDASRIVLNANNSVFPTNVYSTTLSSGTNTAATNIHAELGAVNNAAVSVPTYVSQLNVTAANTNDITFAATNPTLKLTNTLDPTSAAGLKMNGGIVEVAANTANMVPPVADFDTGVSYAKKTLKFSAAHATSPL